MAWYTSGTISLTNGSTTVTGSGTSWVAGAGIGEALYAPDGRIYEIADIASNTSLTLASAYLGTTQSGQAYKIIPTQSYIRDLAADAASLISQYAGIASGAGAGKFTDGALAIPGIAFASDVDTGLFRSGTNTLQIVAGGTAALTATTSGISVAGNTTLGDASTDTVTVNGYMGVGGAGASFSAITVAPTALTNTNQIGINLNPVATSAATSSIRGLSVGAATSANSFTVNDAVAVYINPASKGAGSTINNAHGLLVNDQTQGTNNYGITSAVSSGTNKWNIYASGTAANYFAGNVGIGTIAPTTKLQVDGTGGAPNATATTTATNASVSLSSINGLGTGTRLFGGVGSATYTWLQSQNTVDNSYKDIALNPLGGNVGIGTTSPDSTLKVERADTSVYSASSASLVWPISASSAAITVKNSDTTASTGAYFGLATGAGSNSLAYIGAIASGTTYIPNIVIGQRTGASAYTERLRIDSAGNVGIGASSPQTKLAVIGGSTAGSVDVALFSQADLTANSSAAIYINSSNGNLTRSAVIRAITNGSTAGNGHSLAFETSANGASPTERLRIDSAGNVGIGTSSITPYSASYKALLIDGGANASSLQLNNTTTGSGTNSGGLMLAQTGNDSYVWNPKNSFLSFGTNNAERLRIDSAGNVGIGGASAGGKLEIINAGTVNWLLSNTTGAVQTAAYAAASNGSIGTLTNHAFTLFTNNTERLRIDSSGNLGLGVTPSAWSGFKALQLGTGGLGGTIDTSNTVLTSNAYWSASGWKYTITGTASSFQQVDGAFTWKTAPSGTAGNAITFTQVLAIEKDKSLALQGATSQTGAGISFPATQVASSDANTLDDYREGTFTPTIVGTTTAGTGTYSAQSGRYTRIGNRVFYKIHITWTAHTGTGNITVAGLPFTSANATGGNTGAIGASNLTFSGQLVSYVNNNSSTINVVSFSTGAAEVAVVMDTAATLYISGNYEV